jgi:hypothetical protein
MNPREKDVTLAVLREHRSESDRRSATPPGQQAASTPRRLIIASHSSLPPPPQSPVGVQSRHPRFELRVLPRTPVVNAVKDELASALVVVVRGTQPPVSPSQVLDYLSMHFQVSPVEVQVCRSWLDNFLLLFSDTAVLHRVLHAPTRSTGEVLLIFRR